MRKPLAPSLLLLAGWLLLALGYWGPWVWAEAAGLRVLGLDLAEYVKFMAEARSGALSFRREVFYLPLIALSLSLSLLAHRTSLRLFVGLRWTLNLLAVPVALAMLPPAWTPALLTAPEFITQTAAIALCVMFALLSYPVLRRLPGQVCVACVVLLSAAAALLPLAAFAKLTPGLANIYGYPITYGRGPWQMIAGLVAMTAAVAWAWWTEAKTEVKAQQFSI